MEEWNRDEWQGRSRKNYESSAMGVLIALITGAAIVIIYVLGNLINLI
jgi:hypothetical protein